MTPPLVKAWLTLAEQQRRLGAESVACTLEFCAAQLSAEDAQLGSEQLTLGQAAQISGYSTDHLGRLVRAGLIPNSGRPGAPRIARRELPIKPGQMAASPQDGQLSRTQIVRSAVDSGD